MFKLKVSLLLVLLISITIFSCTADRVRDDSEREVLDYENKSFLTYSECENLKSGLSNINYSTVKEEFDKLTSDLLPSPTEQDEYGHKENYNELILRLNSCEISAEVSDFIYYSYPPTYIMEVKLDSSNFEVKRILDIITPSDGKLYLAKINYLK